MFRIMDTMEMMIEPSTASQKNWSTWKLRLNWTANHEVSSNIAALTMRANSPSVRTMTGSDKTVMTGLIKALSSPNITATHRIVTSWLLVEALPPARWMPGTREAATHRATPLTRTLMTNDFMAQGWHAGAPPPTVAWAIQCRHEPNRPSCLLYTSPSPRDRTRSRMPSPA